MKYISEKRTFDSYECFNHTLDYEIYKIRKKNSSTRNIELKDHPLINKKLKDDSGTVYTVKKINRQFHGGWYLGMLIEDESGSSAFRVFANESSISDTVIKHAREFLASFEEV